MSPAIAEEQHIIAPNKIDDIIPDVDSKLQELRQNLNAPYYTPNSNQQKISDILVKKKRN